MPRSKGSVTDTEPVQLWEWALIRPHLLRHWQVFFEILLYSGVRASEALALTKKDIDGVGIWVTRLKSRPPVRDRIPLLPDFLREFKGYADSTKGQRLFPYSWDAAWLSLSRAAIKAGVRVYLKDGQARSTIHPHLFRHTFGVIGSDTVTGLSPLAQEATLQRAMGHKNRRSTQVYTQGSKGRVDSFILKVQEEIRKGLKSQAS